MNTGFKGHLVVHGDISRNKAKFLLKLPNDLEVRRTVEGISSAVQQFEQMVGDMPACEFHSFEAGADYVSVEDWDAVGDSVAAVKQHGSHDSLGEEGHEGLHTVLYFADSKLFEEDFEHAGFVLDRVHDGFGDEDSRVLGFSDADLFEGIFHEDLHVFPVFNNALGGGIAQLEQGSVL
jgi:hypothetical protein